MVIVVFEGEGTIKINSRAPPTVTKAKFFIELY